MVDFEYMRSIQARLPREMNECPEEEGVSRCRGHGFVRSVGFGEIARGFCTIPWIVKKEEKKERKEQVFPAPEC